MSRIDDVSLSDRIEAISHKLLTPRSQTAELTSRAAEATAQAQETRLAPRVVCNHAAHIGGMQTALDALEPASGCWQGPPA